MFDIAGKTMKPVQESRSGEESKRWWGIPRWRQAVRTRDSKMSVCTEAVGTPYSVSIMLHWSATAGAQVLQWPTATTAASPLAWISS